MNQFRIFHSSSFQSFKADWAQFIDLDQYGDVNYVIRSPFDREILLYLPAREYNRVLNACISQGVPLHTVAVPGELESIVSYLEKLKAPADTSPTKKTRSAEKDSATLHLEPISVSMSRIMSYIRDFIGVPSSPLPIKPNDAKKPFNWFSSSSPRTLLRLKKFFNKFRSETVFVFDSPHVKMWKHLVNPNIQLGRLCGVRISRLVVTSIVLFCRHSWEIYKSQGIVGLRIRLKANQLALMKYLARDLVIDCRALGCAIRRNHSGLPRDIPPQMRRLIREDSFTIIRLYMTLFNLYRILDLGGPFNFDSIVTPNTKEERQNIEPILESFRGFMPLFFKNNRPNFVKTNKLFIIYSVGAVVSGLPAILTVVRSLTAFLCYYTKLYGLRVRSHMEIESTYRRIRDRIISPFVSKNISDFLETNSKRIYDELLIPSLVKGELPSHTQFGHLGRLSLKLEPGGKTRVFAIVDIITSWLLKPLHDCIFDYLRTLKRVDGTFDQVGPIHRLISERYRKWYSYDLSKATDRLPLSLQVFILEFLFGRELAYAVVALLDRPFVHKDLASGVVTECKYSVGQPMGAYSSWALLALTHHLIIRSIAYSVTGLVNFDSYAVLGDDVIICDENVAKRYFETMNSIGVKINPSKSLVSENGTLEFAKRFFYRYEDCSPLSLKELFGAKTIHQKVEMLSRLPDNSKISREVMLSYLCNKSYRFIGQLNTPLSRIAIRSRRIFFFACRYLLSSDPSRLTKLFSDLVPSGLSSRFLRNILLFDQLMVKCTDLLKEYEAITSITLHNTPLGVPFKGMGYERGVGPFTKPNRGFGLLSVSMWDYIVLEQDVLELCEIIKSIKTVSSSLKFHASIGYPKEPGAVYIYNKVQVFDGFLEEHRVLEERFSKLPSLSKLSKDSVTLDYSLIPNRLIRLYRIVHSPTKSELRTQK